ncbi:MAG: ABC transporter ATP-binding protein [Bacteroidota bacterium]|jgi:subfamily B ATP-binding cassette protein MsbA|nr:ABC transporter ATP-binding protein [Bacteroidales bacterium]MDI9535964.1 ABC transporter ATP-binding protein [Bacteroidota bacterium]NLP20378.1 ABC transporter ATP-binding protein [Bacteroidales bacterium]HNY44718.1 ABC transporter ATP-binding protein [Bacteroidales bacterium]HOD89269.1 ABC transporter ATP-binding protein [Bacteroidales bacterium]
MKDFYKIIKYIFPYKVQAILNIFFNVLSTIFSVFSFAIVIPFLGILFKTQALVTEKPALDITSVSSLQHNFNYWLSNIIIEHGEIKALISMGVLVIIATFFKTLCFYLANHFMVPLRNGVVKDIRNQLFDKVISLPIGYFSEEKKGNIIARMTNDVQEIEWGIMSSLEMIFRDPIKILIYLGTMFIISWQMTSFVFILLPIVGLIIGRTGRSLRKVSMTGQQQMGSLMAQIEEMIGGLRIIKAFNAEKHISDKFKDTNKDYTGLMNFVNRKRFLASPLSEFLATIAVVVIMWYGGTLILGDNALLSPAALIGYLVIFSQIISPAKTLSSSWFNIKKAMASVDRVNDILDQTNPIVEKQGATEITEFKNSIEFKNVNFAYTEDIPVLKNINLKIQKGQTVAIVGQSGSGKSTMVDLIPRFYDILEGEILIDGINIKDYKLSNLRELIGYVHQTPILFNDSIANNIAFGKQNVSQKNIEEAAKVANAHDFILESENQYDTNIGDGGCKLSGGQRQRLSIARAVLKNPPILILDEATSALDTESENLVQEALDNLMQNRTSIVIAHRLSTIKRADLICVLHEGQIVETGKHEELIAKKGMYYKLNNIQNG